MYNGVPSLGSAAWPSQQPQLQQQQLPTAPSQPNPPINLDDLFGGPVTNNPGSTACSVSSATNTSCAQQPSYAAQSSTSYPPNTVHNAIASSHYIADVAHANGIAGVAAENTLSVPFTSAASPLTAPTLVAQPSYTGMTAPMQYNQPLPPPPPTSQPQTVVPTPQPSMLYQQPVLPLAAANGQGFIYPHTPSIPLYNNLAAPNNIPLSNSTTLLPFAPAAAMPAQAHSQEDDDRVQLEKIRRLRRELEEEQAREQQKREELQTWGCTECTFRNPLNTITCEMCGTSRKGFAAQAASLSTNAAGANRPPLTAETAPDEIDRTRSNCVHWCCSMCKTVNPITLNRCSACSAFRHTGTPVRLAVPEGASAHTQQHQQQQQQQLGATDAASAALLLSGSAPWRCGICGTSNAAQNANCSACNAYRRNGIPEAPHPPTGPGPASSLSHSLSAAGSSRSYHEGFSSSPSTAGAASMTAPAAAGSAYPTSMQPPPPLSWQCSVCTLENPVKTAVCAACQSGQRPRHLNPSLSSSTAYSKNTNNNSDIGSGSSGDHRRSCAHHHHQSSSHTHSTAAATAGCVVGQQREWPCATCTFVNPITRSKCDMCGAARPEAYAPSAHSRDRGDKEANEASDDDEVQWQEDVVARSCNRCHQEFGLMRRRHHCRACGYVFCATCSPFKAPLKKNGDAERLCVSCYEAREK